MIGTLADNLLAWGCGALNIDATRIPIDKSIDDAMLGGDGTWKTGKMANNVYEGGYVGVDVTSSEKGRFPAHLLHDGSPEVVAMFPVSVARPVKPENIGKSGDGSKRGLFGNGSIVQSGYYDIETSSARFFQSCPYDAADHDPLFYSGKAAKRDREEGCGGLEERTGSELTGRKEGSAGLVGDAENRGQTANPYANGTPRALNHHISVKPTALMRWLVRLFVPPGETVLDPFMGSGSTLKAALLENKTCIGIEMDPEYFAIAVERIKHVSPDDFALEYQQ
jgi:site-specific DNA-methyltransferase (adenine-specific)